MPTSPSAIAFLFVASLAAAASAPERRVENNNVIGSERDPKVRIELPKSVQYLGADGWGYQIRKSNKDCFGGYRKSEADWRSTRDGPVTQRTTIEIQQPS